MTTGGALRPGDELAGYRVDACVGRGGMGEVFRAHDERLGATWPSSCSRRSAPTTPRSASGCCASRASPRASTTRTSSPSTTPARSTGGLYLVMRYVDGTDLRALLRREGALEPARARGASRRRRRGARRRPRARPRPPRREAVERPARRARPPYLADFGLTRSPSDPTPGATAGLLGTRRLRAARAVRGEAVRRARRRLLVRLPALRGADRRAVPFPRPSAVATLFAHWRSRRPRRAPSPALPAELDGVLQRALAKEPAERQATCGQVVAEAREALGLDGARGGPAAGGSPRRVRRPRGHRGRGRAPSS